MHRQKYKTLNIESSEKNRITRAKEYTESRKSHRAKAFNDNRNLSNSTINTHGKDLYYFILLYIYIILHILTS